MYRFKSFFEKDDEEYPELAKKIRNEQLSQVSHAATSLVKSCI
jgi:hypothetical protein